MRLITLVLAVLCLLIQYPLWLGKGGWLKVRTIEQHLQAQERINAGLQQRNQSLEADVNDLKNATGAIEERARSELGMIKQGEIFVQLVDAAPPSGNPATP